MKRRKERRKWYGAKMHEKKAHMHVHLSKEAGKGKGRSALVNKGDTVKVLRGDHKGKTAKVMRVSHLKERVYLEGISHRNVRGVEALVPFHPSNLVITEMKERKA